MYVYIHTYIHTNIHTYIRMGYYCLKSNPTMSTVKAPTTLFHHKSKKSIGFALVQRTTQSQRLASMGHTEPTWRARQSLSRIWSQCILPSGPTISTPRSSVLLSMKAVAVMQGGYLSRLHQRSGCELAIPILFSPSRMSPRIVMMKLVMMTMTMMIKSQRRL